MIQIALSPSRFARQISNGCNVPVMSLQSEANFAKILYTKKNNGNQHKVRDMH